MVLEHILLHRLLDRDIPMKWFDSWFMKKFRWAWQHRHEEVYAASALGAEKSTAVASPDHHNLHDGLSIHLKQVIGGRLITFSCYDHSKDEAFHRTYVVTDEQDFERELGKIITIEAMRR